jgi:glycosyltransferase involved in cell wall biosynthesis
VEKDRGMYDAINRGLRRASGDILAYLNCDEQYLPGCLQKAQNYFDDHPEIDVVFGDVIMVGPQGNYLFHRKMQTPLKHHTWTCHLSTLSCAMFFRRRLFFDRDFTFNPELRDAGDGDWVVRLLRAGVRMRTLGAFTSTFTMTGSNMSKGNNARRENAELRRSAPLLAQALRPITLAHHRLRRWSGGMYSQQPFSYAIYTRESQGVRQIFDVTQPTWRPTP